MIDRSELTRDIIEHYAQSPYFTVYGPAVVDFFSGDIFAEEQAPENPEKIEIISRTALLEGGMISANLQNALFVEGTEYTHNAINGNTLRVSYTPVMDVPGPAPYHIGVVFHFHPDQVHGILHLPNVDVMRLSFTKWGISLIGVDVNNNLNPTPIEIVMGAMHRRFNITGELTDNEKAYVGKLVNKGWSCPVDQLAQLNGALEDIMANVPAPQNDGVLPDIIPGNGPEALPPIGAFAPAPLIQQGAPVAMQDILANQGGYKIAAKKKPPMDPKERAAVAEIKRVGQVRQRFLDTHQTPDEKIADAHGVNQIPEFAQVADPVDQGFGNDGWS